MLTRRFFFVFFHLYSLVKRDQKNLKRKFITICYVFISIDTAVLFIFTGPKLCKNWPLSYLKKQRNLPWDNLFWRKLRGLYTKEDLHWRTIGAKKWYCTYNITSGWGISKWRQWRHTYMYIMTRHIGQEKIPKIDQPCLHQQVFQQPTTLEAEKVCI